MDLFNSPRSAKKDDPTVPLAERVRPGKLDEVVGQPDVTGPESWLSASLEQGLLTPVIFWGPPGVGKTSIARVIAEGIEADFIALSAVNAGVKDIREIIQKASWKKK